MVCVTELYCFALFCIQSLFLCLLPWFCPFAVVENSLVDSEFKEMSCLTPVNLLKPGNRFIRESVSSIDSSVNMESPSQ